MIKVTDLAWARFAAPDLDRMERFLTDFGLVRSARTGDALYMRGTNADHHFHITHLADVNALFIGHEHLKAQGHRHSWGIGRHTIAGQIFDYWFDPFGNRVEHYYGGDFLNAEDPTNITPLKDVLHSQWGARLADRRASLTSDDDPLRT